LTIDAAPSATETRFTGTRYPSAARRPRPCTLPRASAITASVGLSVRTAAGEKAMPGKEGTGGASDSPIEPTRPAATSATTPARTAIATGGTRRSPSVRAMR